MYIAKAENENKSGELIRRGREELHKTPTYLATHRINLGMAWLNPTVGLESARAIMPRLGFSVGFDSILRFAAASCSVLRTVILRFGRLCRYLSLENDSP
jgi:hypothetical protein